MAAKKQAQVIITANASVAERVMQELEGAAQRAANKMKSLATQGASLKEQMRQLEAVGKKDTAEFKALDDQLKQVNRDYKAAEKEFQAFNSRMRENVKDTKRVQEVMKDLAGTATRDLRRALQAAKRELDKMSAKDPNRQRLVNDMKKIQAQIEANTGALKKQQGAWGTLGTTMENLFAYAGIFAGFNMLKSKMEEAYEANKKFSDSMANVRKVSGLAMEDIKQLANNLSKVDSRTSLEGLMGLSYTGAKLGFGNYGIEGLEAFAKSAVKVQNALSEDMGEDSMTALSKLVEVMGLIPKMGVERAMDAAGSAIFKLASTSTATGTNIIEFTKRLMGLANVSHVTTSELLALGSASDSMGLMAEVSATAFNKVFTSIQSNTRGIEDALKFTRGELADLINQGRTMDAIVAVFERMHGMNMDQLKAQGVFKALGSDGARLNNVMITMANRIDMLRDHLNTSNQAFEEGTAVAQEYAIQMDTAAAYSERAANIWNKAFVNPQGVDTVKEFTKAWYEVSKSMTSNKFVMNEIKFIMVGILEVMKAIVQLLPSIIFGLTTIGGYRLGAAIVTGLKPAWEVMKGMTLSLSALRTGFMALSTAARANIFGIAVTALLALGSAISMLNKKVKEASGYMEGFNANLSDLNTEYGKGEAELRRYRKAIDEANIGSKQRAAAIAQFNSKFKPYLSNLLTEKSTALDVAKAYGEVCKQIRTKLALQLKEKDISEQVVPREQWTVERRQEYEQRAKAAGLGQYGATWITGYAQDNQSRKIDDMVREIGKKYYNLPQQIIDEVAKQAATGASEFNNYGNIINSRYLKQANALMAASGYLRQDRSATNALRRVNQKWQPEQDAMDAMLAAQNQEEPITPLEERPTKEELAAAKKAAQEAKQAARKELKDAETETNAIISKIEEWYTLQQNVITDAYNNGEITNLEMTNINQQLEAFKNQALAAARRSLSGQDTGMWEIFKAKMGDLMLDQSEWSKELLEAIQETNMTALRNALMKFDGKKSLEQWGFTSTAFRDGLNKKAAQNEQKTREIAARFTKEAEKMLEQFQVLEVAQEKMQNDLEQMGFITETVEEMAARLQAGILEKPDRNLGIKAGQRTEIVGAFMSQYGNAEPVSNTNDAEQLQQWLNDFTEQGKAKWAIGLPSISDWLADANGHLPEIRRFYNTLMEIQRTAQQREREGQSPLQTTDTQNAAFNDLLGRRISDKEAFSQMGMKFVGMGTIPYTIDITNQQEALDWLRQFATDATGELEGWAQAFPQIAQWVDTLKRKEAGETLGEAELKSLEKAMPQIEALYLRMINWSDNVSANIKKQVDAMMPTRQPIGVDEMTAQNQQRVNLTSSLYDQQIQQANDTGNTEAAVQLEREKNQAIIELEYQFAEQMYQIQQQMGVNWGEELEHEIAMYQNMLDRQLISEQQFQQKKKQLQANMGLKYAQTFNDQMKSLADALQSYEIQATEDKYDKEIQIAQANGQDTTALEEEKEAAIYDIRKKYAGMNAAIKISEIGINTALGIMQAWANPGYPAAIALTAMIAALGAVQTAAAIAEYNKIMGGGSSSKSAKTNVKLKSGMLTYDEGNLGVLAGRRKLYDDGTTQVYDRGQKPFVGQDGRVYMATEQPSLPEGVSIVRQPIATTVNGQQALVAEKGPEIVIGRKTTKRIMMNEPRLLASLMQVERGNRLGRRLYDEGNLGDVQSVAVSQQQGQQQSENDEQMRQTLVALTATVASLQQELAKGISASVNMYGKGGLDESMTARDKFRRRYPV